MKKFLLMILMLLTTSLVYGQGIKWYGNFDEGLTEAKRTGKPMMIDFYTDWCHWCDELDKKVYTNSDVIKLAEDFISVKIDADADEETKEKYRVNAYPTVIFTDSQGKEISRIRGYRQASFFTPSMSQVLDKAPRPIIQPKVRKTPSSEVSGPEDKAKSIYSLGENYEANKMYPQAIREYQKVIKEYPDTNWAGKAEEQIKIIRSKQR